MACPGHSSKKHAEYPYGLAFSICNNLTCLVIVGFRSCIRCVLRRGNGVRAFLLTAGQRRNGTRKFGRWAGPEVPSRHTAGRYWEGAGSDAWRYGDADMTIPDILGLDGTRPDGTDADGRRRQPDRAPGRHAAPKRSFLRRKAARFRARKVVPAAAIAAALAVGAAAYGVTSAQTPGETSARLATVPRAATRSPRVVPWRRSAQARCRRRARARRHLRASGGLTGALAAGMLRSQRALAAAAKSAAAARPAAHPATTGSPAEAKPSPAATPAPAVAARRPRRDLTAGRHPSAGREQVGGDIADLQHLRRAAPG